MKNYILMLVLIMSSLASYGQKEKELTLNEDTGLIEAVYFHDNGVISQKGTFNLDRKLHGEWISYDEAGKKIAQGSYENGLRSGKWLFWQDKSVKEVVYDKNAVASIDGKKTSDGLVKNN
jgi:antitoxin component YwqK of YwqJK toxin-antitoxin module